jgi:hypothetical protein
MGWRWAGLRGPSVRAFNRDDVQGSAAVTLATEAKALCTNLATSTMWRRGGQFSDVVSAQLIVDGVRCGGALFLAIDDKSRALRIGIACGLCESLSPSTRNSDVGKVCQPC